VTILLYRTAALAMQEIFFSNIDEIKINRESSNDLVDDGWLQAFNQFNQRLAFWLAVTLAQLYKTGPQSFYRVKYGRVFVLEQYIADQPAQQLDT
jgi:hypothetical protein